MQPDVIVIGGGVAGMAAAGELARGGWTVRLVEAQGRLGGRVRSIKIKGWPHAVELGAEFMHSGNAAMRAVLHQARMQTKPIETNMWHWENGILAPATDQWGKIHRIAEMIPRQNRGWSFRRFLRESRKKIPLSDRALADAFAGGFNAAPTDRISAYALRDHHAGTDTTDFKIKGRYDTIVRGLKRQWPERSIEVKLNTVVSEIHWHKGGVDIFSRAGLKGREEIHSARAVVITLPLGVLKAGSVVFSPALPGRKSLIQRAGWGQVVRINFRFRRGFWSAPFVPRPLGRREGREFGFLNAPTQAMPTWWALSAPAPILTGWAGGDAAEKFKNIQPRALQDAAVQSLAHVFGISRAGLARWVVDSATHDCRHDPFTLGAYSYPVAGGEDIPAGLAKPVADTLFFAGEAYARDYGTVHGAIAHGILVAQNVNRTLSK